MVAIEEKKELFTNNNSGFQSNHFFTFNSNPELIIDKNKKSSDLYKDNLC
jgi:hypothetical protein